MTNTIMTADYIADKNSAPEKFQGIFSTENPDADEKHKRLQWQAATIILGIMFTIFSIGILLTGKSSSTNEKRLGDVISGLRSDVTGLRLASEAVAKKAEVPVGGYVRGVASHYGLGDGFNGRKTSSGRIYDMEADTVALPDAKMLGQRVLVYNEDNGRAAIGLCTDLGPFVGERVVDCSWAIAKKIGLDKSGLAWVTVVRLGPEEKK